MKIQKDKKNKNRILVSLVLILSLFILILGSYYVFHQVKKNVDEGPVSNQKNSDSTQVDTSPPSDEQQSAGNSIKENSIKQATPSSETGSATVVAFQKDAATVKVDTTINHPLSSGSCTLVITNGDVKKTYYADTQQLANYSTCKGFEIPIREFGPGDWQIDLSFTSESVKYR